jgi:hypothetical protein
MKELIRAVVILAILSPSVAAAKDCHRPRRHAVHHRIYDEATRERPASTLSGETTKAREITIERTATAPGAQVAEVHLDAGPGRTLRQLLSDELGAEVDWGNERLADRVVNGSYHGSRDVVAQKLLKDFDFAIYHKEARMRVIVVRATPSQEVAVVPRSGFPPVQAKPPAECKPPAVCAPGPQILKRQNDK